MKKKNKKNKYLAFEYRLSDRKFQLINIILR